MLKKIFMHNKVRSITLLFLAVLLTIALGSYSQNDPSFNLSTVNEPANLLSYFGSYLSDVLAKKKPLQMKGLKTLVSDETRNSIDHVPY